MSEAQIVGPEQLLVIKGHFPVRPLAINFEITYEPAEGQWQLFGLSVGAQPLSNEAAATKPAAPAAPAGKETKSGPKAK